MRPARRWPRALRSGGRCSPGSGRAASGAPAAGALGAGAAGERPALPGSRDASASVPAFPAHSPGGRWGLRPWNRSPGARPAGPARAPPSAHRPARPRPRARAPRAPEGSAPATHGAAAPRVPFSPFLVPGFSFCLRSNRVRRPLPAPPVFLPRETGTFSEPCPQLIPFSCR